jgi:hypothetical protein
MDGPPQARRDEENRAAAKEGVGVHLQESGNICKRLVQRSAVLDTWMDAMRPGIRVTLYRLASAVEVEGFVAEAVIRDKEVVSRRVFRLTSEGLEACEAATVARLARRLEKRQKSVHRRGIGVLLQVLLAGALLTACAGSPAGSQVAAPGQRSTAVAQTSAVVPAADGTAGQDSCEPVVPRQLPSGAAPAEGVSEVREGVQYVTWGVGDDQTTQAVGVFAVTRPSEFDDLPIDSDQRVEVRGADALVIPVGDPPVSEIYFMWELDGCPYSVWIGPGLELAEAIAYAGRF